MPLAKKKDSDNSLQPAPEKTNTYHLTKTKYCTGIQCLKALYHSVHKKELATPPDEGQQQRFDYGKEVGAKAREYYPGGILVKADHFHREEALSETKQILAQNVPAIFEAAFYWNRTLVRVDILRNNLDGTWDIIEVKSSTDVKDEHIPDMAIQRFIVQKCGLNIRSSILKHINRECTHPDLANLFIDSDCTERVNAEMQQAPSYLQQMFSILDRPEAPGTRIGPHCEEPYECAFKAHCWKSVPQYSVFELTGVWATTKFELYNKGYVRISDIPDGEKVSRSKPEQIQSVKAGKPLIDKSGIQSWIGQLEYPLYFLDFETIGAPIPKFPGTRPYNQVPFQFSCHIQNSPGGALSHIEFLVNSADDPRTLLISELLKALGTSGSIVSYNAKFEKGVIEKLAEFSISNRNELLATLPRFVDLLDIFKKHYFHPEFHGSNSIKATLPVLVPDMSYDGLAVSNGIAAQVEYEKMFHPNTPQIVQGEIRKNLLEYCRQDSLAMARLLEVLRST